MIRSLCVVSIAFGLLSAGCIQFRGQARNPSFVEEEAPRPTVFVAPVSCRSAYADAAGDGFDSQFRVLLETQIKARQVSLNAQQHAVVCATLGQRQGPEISFGDDNPRDWKAAASVSAVVQALAKRHRAKSVFLPMAAYSTACERDQSVLRDSKGARIATIDRGTSTCSEYMGAMLRAYVFSPEGEIYWKSWATVRSYEAEHIERGVEVLLTGAPVRLASGAAKP